MRFDQFVERWCMEYKPMAHVPGETSKNNRFLFVDSYFEMTDVQTSLTNLKSPCVVMESNQEGIITGGKDTAEYTLYFMVNTGTSKPNGRKAHSAKLEAKEHMKKFLAYLYDGIENIPSLRHIEVEGEEYSTVGPLYNGWYAVCITFTDLQAFPICVDPNDYEKIEYGESIE